MRLKPHDVSWEISAILILKVFFFFAVFRSSIQFSSGLQCAEAIKNEFDARWSPHWHVIIGRNFGSFVTHETKCFVFFYLEDKAVMLFKAG
jgi:hypothetical protein